MNEAETKAEYIDPALRAAGWGVVEGSRIRMEFPISIGRLVGHGKRNKPEKADYVLQYRNRNLALIEAKKRDLDYTEGVGQAKKYAERLQIRYTYSTNGLKIYCMDMDEGKEGDVPLYPSPDELWEMTYGEENKLQPEKSLWVDKFLAIPFETKGGTKPPRYYQENAVINALEAVANGQNRILLTLATGTGKTDIAFHIAWKLFKSKWNLKTIENNGHSLQTSASETKIERSPRILFLTDRNNLANQAIGKFNEYGAFDEDALLRIEPEEIKKKGRVPKNASVFFTIFQTFMSGPNETPYFGDYPRDFFDFIIIDECHRGGANDEGRWRGIMEYFSPAYQLGLTATPKRKINIDTYKYFGEPVYVYSLKEGIEDGFLTPFKVKQIDTTIDEYQYTSDDKVIEGKIDKKKKYTEEEINRVIEIQDRERYRVEIFMDMIDQTKKTIVFCSTQLHALAVRNLINQLVKNKNPHYCHRVTADDGKIGEQHLRDFQDNEKTIPTILTTSQKLSTGVDAPEIRNIVLMRPIRTMIEFKQIIGRGTRLYDGKDYFTIYDFVKAYNHFNDEEWDGEPIEPEDTGGRERKPCEVCGQRPCICLKEPEPPCTVCGYSPCTCETEPRTMIKVKLSDGKVRELQHMVKTTFWGPDGRPISAEEFLKAIFGALPDFFKDEEELRNIWSKPDTRKRLLEELNDKGISKSQLSDMQQLIKAEKCDLYDVLAYVAFHASPIEREKRAEGAKIYFNNYSSKQQEFLDFVLKQYVNSGVEELDDVKLKPLLELKYKALDDAKRELGSVPIIRMLFIDFQKYLYKVRSA